MSRWAHKFVNFVFAGRLLLVYIVVCNSYTHSGWIVNCKPLLYILWLYNKASLHVFKILREVTQYFTVARSSADDSAWQSVKNPLLWRSIVLVRLHANQSQIFNWRVVLVRMHGKRSMEWELVLMGMHANQSQVFFWARSIASENT